MSHEITINAAGFAEAAFARTPAWHNLGQVLPTEMTSEQAMSAAHLDWKVVQQPMGRFLGQDINDPQPGDWKPCVDSEGQPKVLANVRQDNGLYLGNVTSSYQVVQNSEAFSFLDALVDDGSLRYESAFSMQGGRKVVLLARMPGVYQPAEGDELLPYVLMSLSHDGTGAIKFGPTMVRIVCANTYGAALRTDRGKIKELSIRHSGKIDEKLADARMILEQMSGKFTHHTQAANLLANHRMTSSEWQTFLNIMCPQLDKMDPDYTERRATAIAKTRASIGMEYHDESNDRTPMTAWAAFNAITAHIDHLPRRGATKAQKAEARFNVTQYGPGRIQKERAFRAACKIANIDNELVELAC